MNKKIAIALLSIMVLSSCKKEEEPVEKIEPRQYTIQESTNPVKKKKEKVVEMKLNEDTNEEKLTSRVLSTDIDGKNYTFILEGDKKYIEKDGARKEYDKSDDEDKQLYDKWETTFTPSKLEETPINTKIELEYVDVVVKDYGLVDDEIDILIAFTAKGEDRKISDSVRITAFQDGKEIEVDTSSIDDLGVIKEGETSVDKRAIAKLDDKNKPVDLVIRDKYGIDAYKIKIN